MSAVLASAPESSLRLGLVLFGVAESGAHVGANRLIHYELRLVGCDVINLGACTSIADFVDAFRSNPETDAIVSGSLDGHACEDLRGLQDARRVLLITCPIIVGGNLDVTREQAALRRDQLLSLSVDHVLEGVSELLSTLGSLPKRNCFLITPERRMPS